MKKHENFPNDFEFVSKEVKDRTFIQHLPMLTGTPSRTGFPRAFLWDDGFHNEIICKWDKDLCLYILEFWSKNIKF
jgi:mannosyl-oligosaccharide glucosidase